jgi:3-oxoacyl-[acyl-carrier-protein] synthase II
MSFGEDFFRQVVSRQRGGLLAKVARYLPQQQVLDLQQIIGVGGSSVILANACASGANAIGHAAEMIDTGAADCVLAGGFEALNELVFIGFDCLQATTVEKCRPFDVHRSGLMIGECAAFLVLESQEHLEARGAQPLCLISGYSHATDFFHLTQPEPSGSALVEVMRNASAEAGVRPEEIGYFNAHGTATVINDSAEAKAFATFLNGSLPSARISSTKAAIGHTLGAAGAVEALFTLQALRTGDLPPQLNLREPLPEVADALVPLGGKRELHHAMSVNLGFGGSNAALLFSRHEN